MRAKQHITPIDMEIISQAHRSVWAALKHERLRSSSDEIHELSDKVTRKLVEIVRAGVIDLETLRKRTLAEIMRSRSATYSGHPDAASHRSSHR
jgi:hypothetical protein